MNVRLNSIARYDVRDPSNPMLNLAYKVDSYNEGNKSVLTLSGAGTKSLELPLILDTSTVYIAKGTGDGSAPHDIDKGTNVTKDEHLLLGLNVLVYEDISEGQSSFTFAITAHQYIELKKGDTIAEL